MNGGPTMFGRRKGPLRALVTSSLAAASGDYTLTRANQVWIFHPSLGPPKNDADSIMSRRMQIENGRPSTRRRRNHQQFTR